MEESSVSDSTSPSFSFPSRLPRKRGRKRASPDSRKYESDDSYNSDVKHVSKWDTCMLESFGIFYDGHETQLSELYESALKVMYTIAVRGIKDHAEFWKKLLEVKEFLVESTKKCMQSFDIDEKFAKTDGYALTPVAVIEVTKKCMQVIQEIKEDMSKISTLDNFSRHMFNIWYTGIWEFIEYYHDLIKELSAKRRYGVEGEFRDLVTFFSKIFLLNPMRW
ncbi:uncharacterized protein LOC134260892 isoform X2 [Saccostrea cucullata]|uniref:uncharacterized protein LOC134260892 isoform X2 n=1 Tax=Saccostrea cuccullata TaxID=36930 RepID=UPI002ED06222